MVAPMKELPITKALSLSFPHLDPTIQVLHRQNLDSLLNITFVHLFRTQRYQRLKKNNFCNSKKKTKKKTDAV